MPKFFLFLVAIIWAGCITYFCLIKASAIPVVSIPNIDKCIHAFFYFVLTFLWFLFFYKQLKLDSIFKPLLFSFMVSFFFGILIEILQQTFTTTRQADALDVVANLVGAGLSVIATQLCYNKNLLDSILKK
ncbi:VanZ family protein [Flavobacterium adhaerens]|uniref:VanZ family protein n=1 Tax=Flavobacterium adhaerens TaxID=3149043 RepID=UPI0032B36DD9